ncbi:MAG: GNAT family N-acetyltransferase [Kangiellaceae bacterium]|nr:GNAT family N-acetyltransferase [Kangiellaceae bacterium]MCW8998142.1 GNAT family N-acetyltransferase [Kangiellaceae bacterium]MCW9016492.1 GNAT family N-acetyltransferase [Kangiellaceae bacterium]
MKIVAENTQIYLSEFSTLDAPGFFEMNNDLEALQFTGDEPFANECEAESFILNYSHYKNNGYGRWSIYRKTDNQYLGFAGLRFSQETKETDIGYRIMRQYWGQGIATQATKLSLAVGFNFYNLESIIGRAMEDNPASYRILEKLGFEREADFEEAQNWWRQYRLTRHQFAP